MGIWLYTWLHSYATWDDFWNADVFVWDCHSAASSSREVSRCWNHVRLSWFTLLKTILNNSMAVCMCVYMYVCSCVHACMLTQQICMCMCMYAHVCVCMCILADARHLVIQSMRSGMPHITHHFSNLDSKKWACPLVANRYWLVACAMGCIYSGIAIADDIRRGRFRYETIQTTYMSEVVFTSTHGPCVSLCAMRTFFKWLPSYFRQTSFTDQCCCCFSVYTVFIDTARDPYDCISNLVACNG